MILSRGEIEPGIQIGDFVIGLKKEDILKEIGESLNNWKNGDGGWVYSFENFRLWFDVDGYLKQIGVTKGFLDGYNGINIGSTLQDVIEIYGSYKEEYGDYLLTNIEGICFELEDVEDYDDDWDELTAPIEWIFVYKC